MANRKPLDGNGGGSIPSDLFGGDDLDSPRAIRDSLNRARRITRIGQTDLEDWCEELEQIISDAPGVPILFGADSRRKARRVCEPLGEAANAMGASSRLIVLTWQRFHHEFGGLMENAAQSKGRKGGRKMDWEEQ
jgi:hypothetical protein